MLPDPTSPSRARSIYGWKARIGLLVPSNNTVIEPELSRLAPEGVSIHSTRMLTHGPFAKDLQDMERNALRGVEELAASSVDVIAFACMSTGIAMGPRWSEGFVAQVENQARCRATTAAMATIEALRAMKAVTVGVGTPFPRQIGDLLADFFAYFGLRITALQNLEIEDVVDLGGVPREVVYHLGRAVDDKHSDAICLLGTDIPTIEVVSALEEDLGKPVISTNQAIFWKCLQLAHVEASTPNYGSLLKGP